jgi:hypothetical protein
MVVNVQDRQSALDIANIVLGGFEGVMALATANDISITDDLAQGQVLSYSPADAVDRQVVKYYAVRGLAPATALTSDDLALAPGGIGYMGIEIDFKIS